MSEPVQQPPVEDVPSDSESESEAPAQAPAVTAPATEKTKKPISEKQALHLAKCREIKLAKQKEKDEAKAQADAAVAAAKAAKEQDKAAKKAAREAKKPPVVDVNSSDSSDSDSESDSVVVRRKKTSSSLRDTVAELERKVLKLHYKAKYSQPKPAATPAAAPVTVTDTKAAAREELQRHVKQQEDAFIFGHPLGRIM